MLGKMVNSGLPEAVPSSDPAAVACWRTAWLSSAASASAAPASWPFPSPGPAYAAWPAGAGTPGTPE